MHKSRIRSLLDILLRSRFEFFLYCTHNYTICFNVIVTSAEDQVIVFVKRHFCFPLYSCLILWDNIQTMMHYLYVNLMFRKNELNFSIFRTKYATRTLTKIKLLFFRICSLPWRLFFSHILVNNVCILITVVLFTNKTYCIS